MNERKILDMLARFYEREGELPSQEKYVGYFCMMMGACVKVEDLHGKVILDYCQNREMGEKVTPGEKYAAVLPLKVNHELVGKVFINHMHEGVFTDEDIVFKKTINLSILLAGAISFCFALLLSLFFSYYLLRPVREMNEVANAIGKGEFFRRVSIKTRDELGELAANLNLMAENLQRLEMLRKKLTADVAHELRTPLAVIQSHLEAFRDKVLDVTDEKIESLQEEVLRLVTLVNDLQDLSLAESGKLKIHKIPLELMELVKKERDKLLPLFEEKGVSLEVEEIPLPPADLDPGHTGRIIANILHNAFKYTPAGGEVKVVPESLENEILLRIKDNGVGIPPEHLPYVFERFYRADSSRTGTQGTGIGLSIVRELITAQGGKIEVNSERNSGTEVLLHFPKA